MSHPVDVLFQALPMVEPYGRGMVKVPASLRGLGFFPGGDGLWKEPGAKLRGELPVGRILVIGNNFQCTEKFTSLASADEEDPDNDKTWRNLLTLFAEVGINRSDCFFSNAFMGLVEGGKPTRTVAGMRDAGFLQRCREFMKIQIALLKPRLILTLGTKIPAFLAPLISRPTHWAKAKSWREIDGGDGPLLTDVHFPEVGHVVTVACLVHPCMRYGNVRFRSYGSLTGADGEGAMLRDALRRSGLAGTPLPRESFEEPIILGSAPIPSSGACLCCERGLPATRPRKCPSCGLVQDGHGWAGFHFHWNRYHRAEMSYEQFRLRLCARHGGMGD